MVKDLGLLRRLYSGYYETTSWPLLVEDKASFIDCIASSVCFNPPLTWLTSGGMKCRYLTTNWRWNNAMMRCVLKPVGACSSVRKCCLFNVDCTFMRMFYWIRSDFYLHPPVRPSPCGKQKQAWGLCEGVATVLNDFPQVHKTRVRRLVDSWWLQILVCNNLDKHQNFCYRCILSDYVYIFIMYFFFIFHHILYWSLLPQFVPGKADCDLDLALKL